VPSAHISPAGREDWRRPHGCWSGSGRELPVGTPGIRFPLHTCGRRPHRSVIPGTRTRWGAGPLRGQGGLHRQLAGAGPGLHSCGRRHARRRRRPVSAYKARPQKTKEGWIPLPAAWRLLPSEPRHWIQVNRWVPTADLPPRLVSWSLTLQSIINLPQTVRVATEFVHKFSLILWMQVCYFPKHAMWSNFNFVTEVFTVVTLNNVIFWYVTGRDSCKNRRFARTYHLHHQGDENRRARKNVSSN
jgi:hypothetical protein